MKPGAAGATLAALRKTHKGWPKGQPRNPAPVLEFIYRGGVERGNGTGYRWHAGYSETCDGMVVYPWMTKKECREEAKNRGGKAVFIEKAVEKA